MNLSEPPMEDEGYARLRVPPHSVEAEQSVLGALLLDNSAWDRAGDVLVESDFYRHEHRLIYSVLGAMINSTKPADVITVYQHLQSLGKDDEAGGILYLNSLAQSVPSAANIRRYAEIVRERSMLRQLVAASDEIATAAFNTQGREAREILEEAEGKIFRLNEGHISAGGFQGIDTLAVEFLDGVTERYEMGTTGDVTGISTGFFDLDRMTSGLQRGDLIVLAARPSMGKSSLGMNIAEHVALNEGLPVAIFSMEMGAAQLVLRLVGSVGRLDQSKLRSARLDDSEWGRLSEAVEKIGSVSISIDESSTMKPAELRARARRLVRKTGPLGLIVVDYLQMMAGSGGKNEENRATVIGEISRSLKGLAKELKCPVLALSQLNRGVEARNDKRPMMSDLRESGAIEQDADVIMFIYRDDYYTKGLSKEPNTAEIIIAKQRSGPTGTVKLFFNKPLTKFDNLASDGYQP